MRALRLGTVMILMAGCRYRPEPVPMAGNPAELAQMAGEWDGDYWSADSRRTGTIIFQISAKGDSAFGDVMMRVPGGEVGPRPLDLTTGHERHARSADMLSIRFVAVQGGSVQGELEPYFAPDCECVARTVFHGRQRGDTISGRFVTTLGGMLQRGEWKVVRILH
jgi:hypothetical protein